MYYACIFKELHNEIDFYYELLSKTSTSSYFNVLYICNKHGLAQSQCGIVKEYRRKYLNILPLKQVRGDIPARFVCLFISICRFTSRSTTCQSHM